MPGCASPDPAVAPTGERGEATPTIVSWQIDPRHYRAVPTMSNGKPRPPLDLRPLFETTRKLVAREALSPPGSAWNAGL